MEIIYKCLVNIDNIYSKFRLCTRDCILVYTAFNCRKSAVKNALGV